MASASTALAPSIAARPFTHTLRIYAKESKYEFLKNLRIPRYSLSVVLVPLMFYVLFGLVMGRQVIGGVNVATYLIASYGTFGVMGASLFGTAAGLAAERGLGWLQVKRASPMPPFAYFVAKLVMSMVFSASVVSLLFLLGVSFGGVRMPWMEAAKMLGVPVKNAPQLKTWSQAVAAAGGGIAAGGAWSHSVSWWLLLVAVGLTWVSGLDYARSAPSVLRGRAVAPS